MMHTILIAWKICGAILWLLVVGEVHFPHWQSTFILHLRILLHDFTLYISVELNYVDSLLEYHKCIAVFAVYDYVSIDCEFPHIWLFWCDNSWIDRQSECIQVSSGICGAGGGKRMRERQRDNQSENVEILYTACVRWRRACEPGIERWKRRHCGAHNKLDICESLLNKSKAFSSKAHTYMHTVISTMASIVFAMSEQTTSLHLAWTKQQ